MNIGQTQTYLLYSRGLMPDELTLGSLHLDPTNPIDSERKVYPYTETVKAQLLRPVHFDQPCSLSAKVNTQWLAGAGVLGILSGEYSASGSVDVTVSGTSGRRLQLSRPEEFLNEVLLESESARRWLAAKLSVLHRMPIVASMQRCMSKAPKIWMVTGLQYVKDGNVSSVSSKERSAKLQLALPVPDPMLMTTLARIPAVDATGSTGAHSDITATYGYEGERVWAAQFRALNVRFRSKSEKGLAAGDNSWIELEDAKSLGRYGIRQGHAEDNLQEGVLGQVAGVNCEGGGNDNWTDESHLIDAMLDVNWALLDELLELQDMEGDEEEGQPSYS